MLHACSEIMKKKKEIILYLETYAHKRIQSNKITKSIAETMTQLRLNEVKDMLKVCPKIEINKGRRNRKIA